MKLCGFLLIDGIISFIYSHNNRLVYQNNINGEMINYEITGIDKLKLVEADESIILSIYKDIIDNGCIGAIFEESNIIILENEFIAERRDSRNVFNKVNKEIFINVNNQFI